MYMPELLLVLLFVLTIGHLITLKTCSLALNHHTAPVFISVWSLAGVAITYPLYGHLLQEGWQQIEAAPYLLLLMAGKAGLLYLLLVISQKLTQLSLSSRHFVTPLAVGLMAIVNFSLGEQLILGQWCAALGLCTLALLFLSKGHLADLGRAGKIIYAQLVGLAVVLAALDQIILKSSNWYTLLLVSNVLLLLFALAANIKRGDVLRAAFMSKPAMLAGAFYAATELVKFYQMVSINPVTAVVMAQAMTKPVIMVLSAYIWKERTVREQLVWGVLAFSISLLMFVK